MNDSIEQFKEFLSINGFHQEKSVIDNESFGNELYLYRRDDILVKIVKERDIYAIGFGNTDFLNDRLNSPYFIDVCVLYSLLHNGGNNHSPKCPFGSYQVSELIDFVFKHFKQLENYVSGNQIKSTKTQVNEILHKIYRNNL